MLTFNKSAVITKANHIVSFDLHKLPEGEYEILVVVEEKTKATKESIRFSNFDVNIDTHQTFRREDMYGDNGR